MQSYPDGDEVFTSTRMPHQGAAVQYKSAIDSLLSFVHHSSYERTKTYTKGELRALTPDDVVRWMKVKAFGVPDPPSEANHTFARSNLLAYWKNSILFFMPDWLVVWVSGCNEGNPTRSIEVNSLIKHIKKKEVRKQGVLSKAKRLLTEDLFRRMQNILQHHKSNIIWRYGLYALTNFQFHLLARFDDTTQVLVENIRVHDYFCNALKTRLTWFKSVTEERDAPWQIILGSMDTVFCVLASLSLWMELNLRCNPNASLSPYVFGFCNHNSIPSGGKKSKETAHNMLSKIFKMEASTGIEGGGIAAEGVGSHSIRKFAATHARRSGWCTKDDKDICGRWKLKTRVSDVYEDTELPFPDAKVAEKLCIGGQCFYLFPDDLTNATVENGLTAMMKNIFLSNVVPNARKRVPDLVAHVLGKALLWLIYPPYDATNQVVPQDFKTQIRLEWNKIVSATVVRVDCDAPSYNLIWRVPFVVTEDQGCVHHIDVVPSLDQAGGDEECAAIFRGAGGHAAMATTTTTTGGLTAQLLAVQSLAIQIWRELQELRANQMADRVASQKSFTVVNESIRRIALQPGVRGSGVSTMSAARGGGNDDPRTVNAAPLSATAGYGAALASLSPNPQNLYKVWQEYQVGIGGRKAAKLFTAKERGGKVKHKYHRRKVVWSLVSGLVQVGLTADTAIDQIYAVYGQQTSVTNIINGIKRDSKAGTLNPNLRI